MIRILLALGALLFANASHAIAFDIDGYKSTWADQRASAVGDIVTVLVQEKAKAVSSAGIDADNAHSIGISSNYKGSAFNLDAGLDSRMNNDASTARNGSISATITTRVIDIDDYGLLKIEGTQFVTVNGEEQKITLSGFVREKDLSPDSAVVSSRIESARIELSGIGEVNDNRKPGIIRALFRWLGF